MKNFIKTFCIMLCCVLTFSLAACGNTETGGNETQSPVNSETNNNSEETSRAPTTSGTDTTTVRCWVYAGEVLTSKKTVSASSIKWSNCRRTERNS